MLSAVESVLADVRLGYPLGTVASLTASQRGVILSANSLRSAEQSKPDNDVTERFERAVGRIKARTGQAEVSLQEAYDEMRNE